jgi:hypothetical protein
VTPSPPSARRQLPALVHVFLARYLETETGGATVDRRAVLLWVGAAMAAPGFVLPVLLNGWTWNVIGLAFGPEVLRDVALADKALAVGISMVVTGLIAAVLWDRMIVDRRDGLILGGLPVRGWTVVIGRLIAFLGLVAGVGVTTNILAAPTFGVLLSAGDGSWLVRGTVGHFVAGFLASAFVLLAVGAMQVIVLLVGGAARFRRWSAALQVALVAAVVFLFLSLPAISTAARDAYRAGALSLAAGPPPNVAAHEWLRWLPPVWFLGLYETIVSPGRALLAALARTALGGMGIVALVSVVGLPVAYRRALVVAVEQSESVRSGRWTSALGAVLVRAAGGPPAARAATQFLLAAIGRVSRHRLAVAAAVGVATAITLLLLRAGWPAPTLRNPLVLGVSYAWMLCLMAGLRLAIGLPAMPLANWVLTLVRIPTAAQRLTLLRLMLLVGVLPAALLVAPVAWAFFGPVVALTHVVLVGAVGVTVASGLLWNVGGMPCARVAQDGFTFRLRWLALFPAFSIYSSFYALTPILSVHPMALAVVVACLSLASAILLHLGAPGAEAIRYDAVRDHAEFGVLGLE